MTTLTALRKAVADIAKATGDGTQIRDAHHYRPATFNASPLVYVDTPSFERTRMGRGAGAKPVTVEMDVVLVVATTWDRSSQILLDELMPLVVDEFDADRTLGGIADTTAYVTDVRGLTASAGVEETPPVGAVFRLRIETKI